MQTPWERHYREQKVSDLTSPLLIPPRLQAATLASRWQASIVHLEQAYWLLGIIQWFVIGCGDEYLISCVFAYEKHEI